MYIKELEVNNFKSFGGDVTIPLLKGFTTIGGPNGSGKSNIIDGILFALGLANARNLRMEQLSDFISTHTNRNEAFVKVLLESENENEEELLIARKVKKSSQGYNSEYYLNEKRSTQTEILAKLEKYRITPNSYNVVMQSDVMSITNCSNTERRKILDELAGIGDFNRRIDKAKDELQIVEERAEKARLILGEIAETIARLAEEKETALKYQALKTEKQHYESRISAVKYFDLKRSIELAHQNILEFNKKKKDEEASLAALEKELTEIKSRYDKAEQLVKNNGEAEQIETKKRLEEIKGQIAIKELAASNNEKNIANNKKIIENTKNGTEKHNKKIEICTSQIEEKKKEIRRIEEIIKTKESELEKVLEEVSGLKEGADKQLAERAALRAELEKLQQEEYDIKSNALPFETDLKIKEREIENAEKELEKLKDFKSNYLDNKDKLTLQVQELEKETQDFKYAQQNIVIETDKTKGEIADLEHDIQVIRQKVMSLDMQKSADTDGMLDRSTAAIMKSGIKGIHAPLMQLAKTDNEYSEALEAAMGGRMRDIAVDDEDTAERCINYLKTANAGRAFFLPMNKMRKAPSNLKMPKERGIIDYAINLLDFDDMYLDVFYSALGETLIVENFDAAKRLIGKYRIVTLDGSVFEKSSRISGGSRNKSGLKFSKNQDEELEKFKNRLSDLISRHQSLREKLSNLEIRQNKIRDNYSSSMTALNSAKIELGSLNRTAGENEEKIAQAEKTIKENEPEIENIKKQLDKTEVKLIKLNDDMLIVQDKIKEIESRMSEGELNKLKEMTAGIENEIKKHKDGINKCDNEIRSLGMDINFQKSMIQTNEQQIKELLKSIEQLEEEKAVYKNDAAELQKSADELAETIKTLGEKLVELQTKRDAARNELLEAENRKNKAVNETEKITEQVEAFKLRRRELEPQLEELLKEFQEKGIDSKSLAPEEISIDELNGQIQKLQKKMDALGDVNMRAIETYEERKARYDEIKGQIESLTNERVNLLDKMNGYEQVKKETFMQTYNHINENFKEIFSILTEGEGNLELEKPDNPFEGGLTIRAQVRDKTKQKLSAMSGGEKSLTALAFVFAIQKYLPAPFYAFDEIDASLDEFNIDKVIDMIKKQSKDTQFIVVSHKEHVLTSSDRMIGVTQKEKGRTHVTAVQNQGR